MTFIVQVGECGAHITSELAESGLRDMRLVLEDGALPPELLEHRPKLLAQIAGAEEAIATMDAVISRNSRLYWIKDLEGKFAKLRAEHEEAERKLVKTT